MILLLDPRFVQGPRCPMPTLHRELPWKKWS